MITAYATNRTLVLKHDTWQYDPNGWDRWFLPLSETCNDPSGLNMTDWPGEYFR